MPNIKFTALLHSGAYMSIKDLKSALRKATTDQEKALIVGEIASLADSAEHRIRNSSREISYTMREWSIEMILAKYEDGLSTDENELFIPDYQRAYKWEPTLLSRFIESIFLGFPIPYMYIADVDDPSNPELDGRIE